MGCVALCTNNELGQWDKSMMEIFGNKMERWVERLTARGINLESERTKGTGENEAKGV